jgi:hypothetical protein
MLNKIKIISLIIFCFGNIKTFAQESIREKTIEKTPSILRIKNTMSITQKSNYIASKSSSQKNNNWKNNIDYYGNFHDGLAYVVNYQGKEGYNDEDFPQDVSFTYSNNSKVLYGFAKENNEVTY